MRFKLLSAALALLMTQSALAAKPSQPPTCPTVDALKVVGVQTTSYDGPAADRVLGVTLKNTYGTADEWTFVIGYFRDDVKSNVLEKANAAVATLELTQGPSKARIITGSAGMRALIQIFKLAPSHQPSISLHPNWLA